VAAVSRAFEVAACGRAAAHVHRRVGKVCDFSSTEVSLICFGGSSVGHVSVDQAEFIAQCFKKRKTNETDIEKVPAEPENRIWPSGPIVMDFHIRPFQMSQIVFELYKKEADRKYQYSTFFLVWCEFLSCMVCPTFFLV
jgi:hypothetical protein